MIPKWYLLISILGLIVSLVAAFALAACLYVFYYWYSRTLLSVSDHALQLLLCVSIALALFCAWFNIRLFRAIQAGIPISRWAWFVELGIISVATILALWMLVSVWVGVHLYDLKFFAVELSLLALLLVMWLPVYLQYRYRSIIAPR